jgi:hypothetical protein
MRGKCDFAAQMPLCRRRRLDQEPPLRQLLTRVARVLPSPSKGAS